jgi:BCD family chlorophyll transporter-like MFS transporter
MGQPANLSVGRNLKIALFHLGSGMADVLATGVWNRIMISDLGFSATPIGLLVSLRYFLAPLGVWAGRLSDRRAVGGYRRLFWIWLGRALMVASLLMLGGTTASLARGAEATPLVWLALGAALLLFSLGNAISGSTFLALIYDLAPEHQRGRAVGLVWTFLLLGFSVGGIVFGIMLPSGGGLVRLADVGSAALAADFRRVGFLSFSPDTLQNLFIGAALIMGGLWLVSLLGEERRVTSSTPVVPQASDSGIWADLRSAWNNPQTRLFFWYLSLSMIFAFTQDLILEPFAGDVFHMDARHTTRFAAYWGSMSILGTLVFLYLARRFPRLTNTLVCQIGVSVLVLTFVVFGASALGQVRGLVTPGLILLGIGLGIWNVGTLGLMMDMSPFGSAGTFLGFWSLVSTLARGVGVSGGGIVRDVMLQWTGSLSLAYGSVFLLEMVGLVVALLLLSRINADIFKRTDTPDSAAVLAAALD